MIKSITVIKKIKTYTYKLLFIKSTSKNKKAFTLAEVLITLAIIGVVAAATIPAIHNNFKAAHLQAEFKKVQYELNQLSQFMKYDLRINNLYKTFYSENINVAHESGLQTIVEKYYKKINNDPQKHIVEKTFDRNGKQIFYKNFSNTGNMNARILDDGGFELTDGRAIWLEGGFKNVRFMITYDINGVDVGPNRYGYDLFSFILSQNGLFYPAGSDQVNDEGLTYLDCKKDFTIDKENSCSLTNTNSCNGIGCAYQASINPNYFKELKY